MNASKFIAAAAVFVAAGSAFAADARPANSHATSDNLNLPNVQINQPASRSRADVEAEAVEFVKSYKTALEVQLEQYKN